ncbi:MAG TPA: phosphatase PAP2 family protein [Chthoniobacterales bacterium]|nr:phosphatase PAP2 family protein [Chthoniobacterales bacterium]
MKDKREFRGRPGVVQWLVVFIAAAVLLIASFYADAASRIWMTQNQSPALRDLMNAVSRYGDWPEHIAVGLILVGIAYWRGSQRWLRIFAAMILACALAGAAARVVKISTGRARPHVQTETGWNGPRLSPRYNAFPSGHTAASTAFFATLAFASWRIGAPFLLVPLLIAFSRMYVAAHYLSDVVGAALIGAITAYVVANWKPLEIRNASSAKVATAAGSKFEN